MAKYLECPACGFVFKAPAADIKFTHIGYTFPGFGLVRCPECKEEKRRKFYGKAEESDLSRNATREFGKVKNSEPSEIENPIEESKFEDE